MKHTKRKLQPRTAGRNKKIWSADEDMVRRHVAICDALQLVHPRWSRCAEGALFAWMDHGSVAIARHKKQPKLGWIAIRFGEAGEQVPLVHVDGREVVFKRRAEAQVAALVHIRDGRENWSTIRDHLVWQDMVALFQAA